jgi:mannose-1-phosphate guanylyltransferase
LRGEFQNFKLREFMSSRHATHPWAIVLAGGEGNRAQSFLAELCGGSGIKQFCRILGNRSMLQQTVRRVEMLTPRERILVSLNSRHRREATEQLVDLPPENLIFQPTNLDTAPGILLPLAHISYRDPDALVAIFPSDHFLRDEKSFMACAKKAVRELEKHPDALILLGVSPDGPDESYGWIEPSVIPSDQKSVSVDAFCEKPDPTEARKLMLRGSLWNTFVFVARAEVLWKMVSLSASELYCIFSTIRLMLPSDHTRGVIEFAYRALRPVNFSSAILSKSNSHLRVIRVPPVGWSDWGTKERILASLEEIGRLDECLQRVSSSSPMESLQAG